MPNNNIALMRNGIFKEGKSGKYDFIQYNDYFEHKSFFQCPKCLSLNVEDNHIYAVSKVVYVKKDCMDCGFTKCNKVFKEGDND